MPRLPADHPLRLLCGRLLRKLDLDLSFDLARGADVMMGTLQGPFGKSTITLSKL